ncbi:MAG TPA: DUF2283 domain-containing protein [Chloroflexota bacterium]|jgi:uncharacterized protein YuzE
MKVTYDPDPHADAVYIELNSTPPHHATELAPGVYGDYDADGNMVGLEVLDASKRMDDPMTISLELLTERVPAPA